MAAHLHKLDEQQRTVLRMVFIANESSLSDSSLLPTVRSIRQTKDKKIRATIDDLVGVGLLNVDGENYRLSLEGLYSMGLDDACANVIAQFNLALPALQALYKGGANECPIDDIVALVERSQPVIPQHLARALWYVVPGVRGTAFTGWSTQPAGSGRFSSVSVGEPILDVAPIPLTRPPPFALSDEGLQEHGSDVGSKVFAAPWESAAISSFRHDAFISHASEDKDALVRPIATVLKKRGFDIWFDEFELRIGDSLRRSIDKGLSDSRYGIVVLSPDFFAKNWPQYELDGLVAREVQGHKVILPIWHNVSKHDVLRYSPTLADKVALSTASMTMDAIGRSLADVLSEGKSGDPRPSLTREGVSLEKWVTSMRDAHGTAFFPVDLDDLSVARAAQRLGLIELKELRSDEGVVDAAGRVLT